MLTSKQFNTALTTISASTMRDKIQSVTEYAFSQYSEHGDTSSIGRVVNAVIKSKMHNMDRLVRYIKHHANVSMIREGDSVTFKKIGKSKSPIEVKEIIVTWYDFEAPQKELKEKSVDDKKLQYAKTVMKRLAELNMTQQELLKLIARINAPVKK